MPLQADARQCDKRSSRRLFELSVFGSVTNADCIRVSLSNFFSLSMRVCVCGDLWAYLLLVWFYELSVKLRQAHAQLTVIGTGTRNLSIAPPLFAMFAGQIACDEDSQASISQTRCSRSLSVLLGSPTI